MMPLWLDIEDFEDEEEALWGRFCDQCLEPIAVCHCGNTWPDDMDEDNESEEEEDE